MSSFATPVVAWHGDGEHHRFDFAVSFPPVVLAAVAQVTERIRLTSTVTVRSSADPVKVFEDFATVDLISAGSAASQPPACPTASLATSTSPTKRRPIQRGTENDMAEPCEHLEGLPRARLGCWAAQTRQHAVTFVPPVAASRGLYDAR